MSDDHAEHQPHARDFAHARATKLDCPRCGYDLSGAAAQFVDACPLTGRCPECGLDFAWLDVFVPDRHAPKWLFEHRRGWWRGVLSVWQTWISTFAPRRFYRLVRVEHRVVVPRLWLWLLIVLALPHAVASCLAMLRLSMLPTLMGMGTPRETLILDSVSTWTYPLVRVWPNDLTGKLWPPGVSTEIMATPAWVVMGLAMHLGFGGLMMCLPWTLRAAKVRRSHVARALVYGLSWVVLLAVFRATRNALVIGEMLVAKGRQNNPGAMWAWTPEPMRLEEVNPVACSVVCLGFIAMWWAAAIVVGWRIKRAWAVWGLLTFTSLLGAVAAGQWWMLLPMFVSWFSWH